MKILHRFTGAILFEHETRSMKVCVKAAIEAKANLRSANLRSADLRYADLSYADLSYADLSYADLRSADLSYANLDFSSGIAFKCSSFDFKADFRLAAQIAYHFCRIDFGECVEAKTAQDAIKNLANQFHRVGECGLIK